MSLFKWELKKIFQQKTIYIVAVFMLGFVSLNAFDREDRTANREVYREWAGPVTAEKLEKANKLNEELTKKLPDGEDLGVLSARERVEYGLGETLAYSQNSVHQAKNAMARLDKRIKKAEAKGDDSLVSKLKLEKNMFSKVEVNNFAYHDGPQEVVDTVNTFGLVFSGLLLVIGLAGIYSNERSSGVENYILSAKNGREKIMRAKLFASFVYALAVVALWELYSIGIWTYLYGTEGWNLPIQYSFKYYFSPYSMTFTEYHFMQMGIHLLATLALAGVIVIVSMISRSSMISLFGAGVVFGLPVFVESMLGMEDGWVNKLLTYSLTNIMKVEGLYMKFKSVSLFGVPVIAPYVGIAISIVVLGLTVYLTRFLIVRKQVA
jgi:ABC-type transport system involved in multi-copper enzyme maturation permease subunit